MEYIKTYSLEDETNYQYIQSQIDLPNWIDCLISNLYHHNTDWPHHNTKFWSTPDRKWRQILLDQDVTMGMTNLNKAYKDPLDSIHADNYSYLAIFYKELLKNEHFVRDYSNRFADLMNTIFLAEEYLPLVDEIMQEMEVEMPRHSERWNHSFSNWIDGPFTGYIRTYEGFLKRTLSLRFK